MFHTSGTKHGSYSVGLTVLVIAIVIVFNLVIGQIPEAYRNLDMSSTKIYEISDTTKDLLSGLNDKVDMKVLAVKKDTDDRIKTFFSKYAALSDKINVEWIDPVLHPSALTEYNASENTIVVSCEATGKTTTISFDKILVMDMSSYYYSGNASYSEFDGDGQLTSAVNYVTSDAQKTIYKVSGHGEAELSSTVTDLMSKNNYTLTELNLLMADSIPDDCDLLLMNAPTNDLSENEVTLLTNYLAAGGKVMCLLGDTSLTDFAGICVKSKNGRTDHIFSLSDATQTATYQGMKVKADYAVISNRYAGDNRTLFMGNGTQLIAPGVSIRTSVPANVLLEQKEGKWYILSSASCTVVIGGKKMKVEAAQKTKRCISCP